MHRLGSSHFAFEGSYSVGLPGRQAMVATLQAQLALPPTSAVASETLRTESIHVEAERLRQRVAQREVQLLGGETVCVSCFSAMLCAHK